MYVLYILIFKQMFIVRGKGNDIVNKMEDLFKELGIYFLQDHEPIDNLGTKTNIW